MAKKKSESIIPQTKLLRLFQIISVLRTGRWSIKNLAERFDTSERTIYRYIKLMEEVELVIDKDFENRYFIHASGDEPGNAEFTIEEMKLIKKLIQAEVENNPLRGLLLKKLSLNSELDKVPRIIVKARLGKLIEQLAQSIRSKKQIILKSYHSAHSNEVRDRLIEPFEFGDNYQTVVALDTNDRMCKQFKLDRIGEIVELDTAFKFEPLHQKKSADIFGMTGAETTWITLRLGMRAWLLLREEHPLSIPYTEKRDDGSYQFHGPVSNFEGVARFVLGLLDDIVVLQPPDFVNFLSDRIASSSVVGKHQ